MVRKLLVVYISIMIGSVEAGSVTFNKRNKPADDYKHHKCINGSDALKALTAKLSVREICEYGKMGCSSMRTKSKLKAYCDLDLLSECFNKKRWVTIDQILGEKLEAEPGLVTYGANKSSKNYKKTCAYWD